MEDVIREIADKLGVGMEQVYSSIPAFGQMVAMQYSMILILLIIITTTLILVGRKLVKSEDREELGWLVVLIGCCVGIVTIVAAVILLPDILSWIAYPYEKFLQQLITHI